MVDAVDAPELLLEAGVCCLTLTLTLPQPYPTPTPTPNPNPNQVRRSLRTEHGFPLGPPGGTKAPPPWGVPAVYSIEEVSKSVSK